MAKSRVVAVSFVPEAADAKVRPVGRVLPGEIKSWQYFETLDSDEAVDSNSLRKEKPAGWALLVNHEEFAPRALVSRLGLRDLLHADESEAKQLFELTPDNPEAAIDVTTAVSEVGKYVVRLMIE